MCGLQIRPKRKCWKKDAQRNWKRNPTSHISDSTDLSMLKFMTVQLENDWTSMVCVEGFAEESGSIAYVCIWTNYRTSGTLIINETKVEMFCHNALQHLWRKQHISTKHSYQMLSTVVEGRWYDLVLQPQDLATLQSESRPRAPLYIKVLESQMWGTYLIAEAWLKLGHAIGQLSEAQQQSYNRTAE